MTKRSDDDVIKLLLVGDVPEGPAHKELLALVKSARDKDKHVFARLADDEEEEPDTKDIAAGRLAMLVVALPALSERAAGPAQAHAIVDAVKDALKNTKKRAALVAALSSQPLVVDLALALVKSEREPAMRLVATIAEHLQIEIHIQSPGPGGTGQTPGSADPSTAGGDVTSTTTGGNTGGNSGGGGGGGGGGGDGSSTGGVPAPDTSWRKLFKFDGRNLSEALKANDKQDLFVDAVRKKLKQLTGLDPAPAYLAAVVGKLVLGSQTDSASSSFGDFVTKFHRDLTEPKFGVTSTGREVFGEVEKALRAKLTSGALLSFQKLAFIGDAAFTTVATVPIGSDDFTGRITAAELDYASGAIGLEDLELPNLESGTDSEVVPENIDAVGMLYAAYQLEQLKLFQVVDRITDLFNHGLIPIGFETGGQLLNDYWWARNDRYTDVERAGHYGRVFGQKGAPIPREVQPNAQFDALMLRFLSTVAEFQRQQNVAALFGGIGRPQDVTIEHVRKAGRELAANVSLYGWASTHYAARRLNTQVKSCLEILKQPSVQQAFGATNLWQVIERVAQQELGTTPNIVKYWTMAQSGKAIFEVLSRNAPAWRSAYTAGTNVLIELVNSRQAATGGDADKLVRNAQAWLSVNGYSDDQVDKLSQPTDATALPSLPLFGAQPAPGAAPKNGTDNMAKLREMVAAGQTPSLDQLQRLITN